MNALGNDNTNRTNDKGMKVIIEVHQLVKKALLSSDWRYLRELTWLTKIAQVSSRNGRLSEEPKVTRRYHYCYHYHRLYFLLPYSCISFVELWNFETKLVLPF